MIRAFKYSIKPTKIQTGIICNQFELCRELYNTALEHRIASFKAGKPVFYHDQQNELPEIKKQFPEFKKVNSQVLQNIVRRLDIAFQNFFRRVKNGETPGFPRFKGSDRFHSITYPQFGFKIKGNRIKLHGIGNVKIKIHRDITGCKIKTCTIKKSGNKWFCILVVETNEIIPQKKNPINTVGIDLGIETFATLSNGDKIIIPERISITEGKIKDAQRKYSLAKTKNNKNKITNLYRKITDQKHDFLHKESKKLVDKFDMISYENLNISAMISSPENIFNKGISDSCWGKFIYMLKYKAESAGTYAIAVNPKYTSQKCSNCEALVKKGIKERFHNCHICGLYIHRDLNASYNVLKLGTNLLETMIKT